MFSRVRVAIRFFFMGLAVGVLLAPRSGRETRRLVRERADRLLNDLLDAPPRWAALVRLQRRPPDDEGRRVGQEGGQRPHAPEATTAQGVGRRKTARLRFLTASKDAAVVLPR